MANPRYDQAFALFDADKDGKISKSEMRTTMQKLGRTMNDQELQTLMKSIDKDGNDYIDRSEFYQMMEALKANEGKSLKAVFDKYDKDHNGFISQSELKAMMIDLGVNLSDQEVGDMLKGVDVNKDGKISFEEYKKFASQS